MVVGDDAVVVVASCPNVADRREVVASGFDGNYRCQSVRKEVGKLRVKNNKEVRRRHSTSGQLRTGKIRGPSIFL